MIAKRCLLVLVFMVLIFLFTPSAHPGDKIEIESLRGLTGVYVIVEGLDDETKRELPFDKDQIRVDTELKLRMAGIKVFSKEEWLKTPGAPFLYVNLTIRRMPNMPLFYFNIAICLKRFVYLEPNPGLFALGTTWDTNAVGAVGKEKASQVRDSIKDLLDIFINDYLSVNPKGGK